MKMIQIRLLNCMLTPVGEQTDTPASMTMNNNYHEFLLNAFPNRKQKKGSA
jgi:hypothetical protein